MNGSPQIECPSCQFPILLAFVERDGAERRLTCPCCGHEQSWRLAETTLPADHHG